MDPHHFKLQHPVTVDGVETTVITLRRRPKARDLMVMDKRRRDRGDLGAMLSLIADLAELDRAIIEELDLVDLEPIQAAVVGFLPGMAAAAAERLGSRSPPSSA